MAKSAIPSPATPTSPISTTCPQSLNWPPSCRMPSKFLDLEFGVASPAWPEPSSNQSGDEFDFVGHNFPVYPPPLPPCFHTHSRGANDFARCKLGVLVSAAAAFKHVDILGAYCIPSETGLLI